MSDLSPTAPALTAAELAAQVPVTPIEDSPIDTAAAMAYVEPRAPQYRWGQKVIALYDLTNDGSHPEFPAEAVLAARGTVGEIVNIGHATEENEPVYLVEFERRVVVGCLEDEILLAPAGLLPESDELEPREEADPAAPDAISPCASGPV